MRTVEMKKIDRTPVFQLALFVGFVLIGMVTLLFIMPVEGRTITVDGNGEGDHVTIRSAVENATDGDQTLIWPGLYNESLEIRKELYIEGMDSIIELFEAGKRGGRSGEVR